MIKGYARFVDAHTIEVNGEEYRANHIVIATGAKPVIPNVEGKELGGTSDDVFAWDELPQSVAILGAGYIAVELAGVLHALGVKTDLFVRRDRPLRGLILTSLKVWSRKWKEQTCHFILTKSLSS